MQPRTQVWRGLLRFLGVGPVHRSDDESQWPPKIWSPWLALNSSVALFAAALAANASRADSELAVPALYLSIALLFLPAAVRLMLPHGPSTDRLAIVLIVGMGLYCLRVIRAPLFFVDHDEYLHLVSAQNIVHYKALFISNTLFPVGPAYPGLEIATTALSELSGTSIFAASVIVLAAARLVFVGCLYFLFARITGSNRVAGLACIFYMGCSTFVFFDTHFAYESLALAYLALALLLDLILEGSDREWPIHMVILYSVAITALAITHHMTAYLLAALFGAAFVLQTIKGGRFGFSLYALTITAVAVVAPLAWSHAMGNPGASYLGPVLENGVKELFQLIKFAPGRKLFTADDGVVAPIWQRYTTFGAVALICLGLALGFFRSLSWADMPLARGAASRRFRSVLNWRDSRLVLLTMLTFGYPASIIFRLTRSGWEIGNRIGPFAFLGVGVVLAICIVVRLQGRSTSLVRATVLGACATIIVVGGIISAEGPRVLVPGKYQVSADAASIEPMGISAALWTKKWLGPGNHFTADRVNRLLLSGFGEQLVSTTLQHGYDTGVALVAETFGNPERDLLSNVGIDYLFADLRLTTGLPKVGSYFDGAVADQMLPVPPQPSALLKFDALKSVGRPFDNGFSVIYDVRVLSGRL